MSYPVVQLQDIAEVKLGRQRSPKHHAGDQMRPYVRAANIGWMGWQLDDVKSMNFTDAEMNTYRLEPGDILLGEASGSAAEVGKPAIWNGEIPDCAFQNTLIRVRPRCADGRYLLHFFAFCATGGHFARKSRGVGIFHLGRKALAEWEIPFPPIEEQRRIAAVLDAADALRAKRRQALAELDTLTQAIFNDIFGDPVANPKGWIADRVLSDVADVRSGITKGRKTGDSALEEVPFLAVVNVQDGYITLDPLKTIEATAQEVERYALLPGDILLTEGGDPDKLGRGAVWDGQVDPCIHQNHVFRVRLLEAGMTPDFLSRLLGSARGKRYFLRMAKQTTGIASINMTQLKAFPLLEPPIELQHRFLQRVEVVAEAEARGSASAEALDSLFASLQQRAFMGDL